MGIAKHYNYKSGNNSKNKIRCPSLPPFVIAAGPALLLCTAILLSVALLPAHLVNNITRVVVIGKGNDKSPSKNSGLRKQQQHTLLADSNRTVALSDESVSDDCTSYVRSFWKSFGSSVAVQRGRLAFSHVPKTGGTSIEAVAARQKNLSWGMCAFPRNAAPYRDGCPDPPFQELLRVDGDINRQYSGGTWARNDHWHIPRQYFPIAGVDPYLDAELFVVVRDTYDRTVSEFNFQCGRGNGYYCDKTRNLDASYMNEWIRSRLQQGPSEGGGKKKSGRVRGHVASQYSFVIETNRQVRMADHVLIMERNLPSQFVRLVRAYGLEGMQLNQRLNTVDADAASDAGTPKFLTADDLDTETVQLLNELYPDEFSAFGYAMK